MGSRIGIRDQGFSGSPSPEPEASAPGRNGADTPQHEPSLTRPAPYRSDGPVPPSSTEWASSDSPSARRARAALPRAQLLATAVPSSSPSCTFRWRALDLAECRPGPVEPGGSGVSRGLISLPATCSCGCWSGCSACRPSRQPARRPPLRAGQLHRQRPVRVSHNIDGFRYRFRRRLHTFSDDRRALRSPRPPRGANPAPGGAVELKVSDPAPDFRCRHPAANLQALRLQGQGGGRALWFYKALTSGCTISASRWLNMRMIRRTGDHFMASVDPLEKNVSSPRRQRQARHKTVEKKEADFPSSTIRPRPRRPPTASSAPPALPIAGPSTSARTARSGDRQGRQQARRDVGQDIAGKLGELGVARNRSGFATAGAERNVKATVGARSCIRRSVTSAIPPRDSRDRARSVLSHTLVAGWSHPASPTDGRDSSPRAR